jgi:hypothetical protein
MKKTMLTLGIVCTLLNACAYKPIIDTAGRSGTFNSDQAKEITNDEMHCEKLAKDNTNFISNITFWALNQNMDTKYESIMRKCLTKRGHSVLN